MNTSEALFEKSKKIVPGGVHSPVRSFQGVGCTPVFIKKAYQAYLESVEGTKYIDFCMGFGPHLFGHQPLEIKQAITQALEYGCSFGAAEPYSFRLAEYIHDYLPWVEQIRFVNSGTEAVMSAIRIAKGYTQKPYLIKFEGCYHGHVDSLLVKAGSGLAQHGLSSSAGVCDAIASQTFVCPLNNLNILENIFQQYPNSIAALIIEPLPANYGLLIQTYDFLEKIINLAHHYNTLVIFDEVISGFRINFEGMTNQLLNKPDLFTFGKILGGGLPVGAVGGKKKYMQSLAPLGPVYQAGTLSANTISMAAGYAALKKCKEENPYPCLRQNTLRLKAAFEELAYKKSIPAQMVVQESIFWIVFGETLQPIQSIQDIPVEHLTMFQKFFNALLKKGIYLSPSAFEVCFLSTAHTSTDLEYFIDAIAGAFNDIQNLSQ